LARPTFLFIFKVMQHTTTREPYMDEFDLDLCLCESLCLSHDTDLPMYFAVNESLHCDLFEIQLYNDLAQDLEENNSELLNLEIEKMVADLAA
ncbi:MAG: hypothetical protein WCS82_11375, partial [Candidatus Riflebacteria bacterium]